MIQTLLALLLAVGSWYAASTPQSSGQTTPIVHTNSMGDGGDPLPTGK
jgi:hypothetical protein